MDFSLIEHHPWATAGIVLGGGVLLYFVLRRGSSSSDAQTGYYAAPASGGAASTATDNTVALQTQQMNTYLAGLSLQGATQVNLASISADVAKYTTGLTAEVTDTQTAAQLDLGKSTLDAATKQAEINAGITSKYIDALVAVFTGSKNPAVNPAPVTTGNPIVVQVQPSGGYTVTPPTGTGGAVPIYTGGTNPGTLPPGYSVIGGPQPGDAPLAGGTQLLPSPNYAQCSPWDTACVMGNQQMGIDYQNALIGANNTNNRNQCLANAARNAGEPNYAALIAACG